MHAFLEKLKVDIDGLSDPRQNEKLSTFCSLIQLIEDHEKKALLREFEQEVGFWYASHAQYLFTFRSFSIWQSFEFTQKDDEKMPEINFQSKFTFEPQVASQTHSDGHHVKHQGNIHHSCVMFELVDADKILNNRFYLLAQAGNSRRPRRTTLYAKRPGDCGGA